MLYKLGENWIDPGEIAAVQKPPAPGADIYLRNGTRLFAAVTREELEAFFLAAGLIPDEDDGITIDEADTEELYDLHDQGYRYLARDIDGKLYAYAERPRKNAGYWEAAPKDAVRPKKMNPAACLFVEEKDEEPFDIASLY